MDKENQKIPLLQVLYLIFQDTDFANELDVQLRFLSNEIRVIKYQEGFNNQHWCRIEYVDKPQNTLTLRAHPGFESLIPTKDGLFEVIGSKGELKIGLYTWPIYYLNPLIADVRLWQKMIALLYLRNMDVTLDFTNPEAIHIQALDDKTNCVLNITPPEGVVGHNVPKLRYLAQYLKDQRMRFTNWVGFPKPIVDDKLLSFNSLKNCWENNDAFVPKLDVKCDCDFAIRRWFGAAEINDYLTVESDGTIKAF